MSKLEMGFHSYRQGGIAIFMSKNKHILMIYILLIVAAIAVFWGVNECDFINYDDPSYVTENNHIQYGISTDGIRWAFTTGYFSNWHPLTWISHMLDVQLFGLQPRWHHLTNLLFHIANTLLLFFVLHRMTKAHWESAFVAALFALHPLHVESVAWVAERKDVLSMFFWMLTMGAYCWYVEHPRFQRYLIVVVFFALGLMAKPMLVTLPFVLLLLDYWPLQRFQQIPSDQKIRTAADERVSGDKQKGNSKKKDTAVGEEVLAETPAESRYRWALIRSLLWEKIPLFALTVLSSIVTYFVQQHGGSVASFEKVPLSDRFSNTFISYIAYIGQAIWPNNLAVLYPYPLLFPTWQVIGAALLLTAITITVIGKTKRAPYLAMGWLWYVGTLVPVIGIVQVGLQARADRYTYIPLIGLFIMATWGISEFSKNWRYRREALIASSTVVLLFLCIVTWTQVWYWKNSITLFEHALNVTENNYIAYYNRGIAYSELRNYRQAIGDYDKVIEIKPKYTEAYSNRGNAYLHLGNDRQAIGDFDKAIEINPKHERAYNNRGTAYSNLGNDTQAIRDYDKAVEINPKYEKAYNNRGKSYSLLGNYRQAIGDYDKAIEINPKYAKAYNNRGNAYTKLGNYRQAIGDFDKAIEINPKYVEAYYNRGYAYSRIGNNRQASEDLKRAAKLSYKDGLDLFKKHG
jgi:protein O-mannosyl-transferase